MEDLIIIGAGGSSREVAAAVESVNQYKPTWNLLGYLDDDPDKLGETINGFKVLGPIDTAKRYPAQFIIGIASARVPLVRKIIAAKLALDREQFATIIHPTAFVSRHTQIGVGCAVLQNAVITQESLIGDHVLIHSAVLLGHDSTVGDFATFAPGAIISGSVHLHSGVYVGAGAMIRERLTINAGAVIGMGAVVTAEVIAGVTVVGNPARPMRKPRCGE